MLDTVRADPDSFWSDDFENGGVGGWEGMLGDSDSEDEENLDDDVGPDDEAFHSPVESGEEEDSEEYSEEGSEDEDDESFSEEGSSKINKKRLFPNFFHF